MNPRIKFQLGKMLLTATSLSILIAVIGLTGVNNEVQKIDCNSDSNMTGYNQPPYGNDQYPSNTIEGKKEYCNSQVKQAKDFVTNNSTLCFIFYPILIGITAYLLINGKRGYESEKRNYRDPSHGTLPRGFGK